MSRSTGGIGKPRLLLIALSAMVLVGGYFVLTGTTASAASSGNFIATGHDLDFHCTGGPPAPSDESQCLFLEKVVQKVQNGSTLPILALDSGTEIATAIANTGVTSTVTTLDPTDAAFATTPLIAAGVPLYSAIVVASDESCGGCDNNAADIAAIAARSADIAAYFNAGGGILALAGADNFSSYYNFVPLPGVTGAAVTSPFVVTADGTGLGLTDTGANCCATHNSFTPPSSPFVVLETDSAGLAETIGAFNAVIGDGGFTTTATPTSADTATVTVTATVTSTATVTATVTSTVTATETVPGPTVTETVTDTPTGTPTCKEGDRVAKSRSSSKHDDCDDHDHDHGAGKGHGHGWWDWGHGGGHGGFSPAAATTSPAGAASLGALALIALALLGSQLYLRSRRPVGRHR